jgi:hypothetical protein
MADQAVARPSDLSPPVKLSEGELTALRDHAATFMLERAGERLRFEEEHDLMIASAEVYGALRNEELAFPDSEAVEVEFTDKALAWLHELRDETRNGLEGSRGTTEINEHTAQDAFLLFILDGICDICTPTE